MTLVKRADFQQVGDYLYSQDLCVGVFDGTDFNSGTCESSKLTAQNKGEFPADDIIIRYNQVQPNITCLASVLQNLTRETQAQCVMTWLNATACWIWNDDLTQCIDRYHYNVTTFSSSDGGCARTLPIENGYSVYVRRSDFKKPSSAPSRRVSLKAVALVAMAAIASII
ncbi:hypothetical protein LPJ53_005453 [Coemansia erecta]|uniref:Uncharacterized protein n=1 Tax=Coemansia erecta TaxID=147472 RepID=A0A9W8CQI1_9FUNG|nr:hypothetical protein LPJ53_005453 [Coemansia erecta]